MDLKNPRPRPRILDKQRPEAKTRHQSAKGYAPTDKNVNMGVPPKLRHGAQEAFELLARRNAAIGGK